MGASIVIRPVNYSITIIRRSTFKFKVEFTAPATSSSIDFSSFQFISQLWDRARTQKYSDFTINVDSLNNGQIELSLTADQTINLPKVGVYDVKAIYPSGEEYFLIAGNFTVQEGYSDD